MNRLPTWEIETLPSSMCKVKTLDTKCQSNNETLRFTYSSKAIEYNLTQFSSNNPYYILVSTWMIWPRNRDSTDKVSSAHYQFYFLGNRARFTVFQLELPVELDCYMRLMALFFCTVAFVTPLYFTVAKSGSLFSALGPLPSSKCKEQIYVSFEICSSFWKSLRPHRQKLPTFSLLSLIFRLILLPQTHEVFQALENEWKMFPPAFDLDIGNPNCSTPTAAFCCFGILPTISGNNFLATVLCIGFSTLC